MLESSGWRRGGEQNWLTPENLSFIADLSYWELAVGISVGRSNAVSSLGSTGWSSRISCISGLWYLVGMNRSKLLREDAGTQSLGDSTHSGGSLVVP